MSIVHCVDEYAAALVHIRAVLTSVSQSSLSPHVSDVQ